MSGLIAPTINLVILLGILVYYLKPPLREFVYQRHHSLREELKTVRNLLRTAQEKHNEFSVKLKSMESEAALLFEQARQDGQSMKLRRLSEAKKMSATLLVEARTRANGLFSELKEQFYLEITAKILEKAETFIKERLTEADQVRICQEFSRQLESVP